VGEGIAASFTVKVTDAVLVMGARTYVRAVEAGCRDSLAYRSA
jgi:hypothetical protein